MVEPQYALVPIRYKVGVREVILQNVNLDELRQALQAMLVHHQQEIDSLLQVESEATNIKPDLWIEAMMTSPAKLEVTEDMTCKTNFTGDFWKARTPAGTVACLLESMIQLAQKRKKEQEALIIRTEFLGGTLPPVSLPDGDKQVAAWIANWEATHTVV